MSDGIVKLLQDGEKGKKDTVKIYARCYQCLELLEVKEIEGSSLNSIIVTVDTSHKYGFCPNQ